MAEKTAVQGRKVRFSPRAMVLAAGCLVLAGAVGRWAGRDGGLLWVARLFDHPLLFGLLVLGLLAAALMVAVRSLVVRVLTGVALGLALLASFPFVLFAAFGAASETSDTAAPGRDDRSLVVEEGADMIDPLWWVYVDEGRGPMKQRWRVGYFNGDAAENSLVEAVWDGPDRVRLVTGYAEDGTERVHLVDLDHETGRPLRTVTRG
ncbi:hypothetical protein [Streptomyces sp. WAC08241]|uniref:hypothetical protein n=1 Tax=Streptomyces sp. WAC08241 TaxID=2487421 RepID=UPI000F78FE00|nr:hypothetical protein [Streptomyces sp. WAC08241]RSS35258.1 hypothetical protein EF906_27875 [Streptomyces sp. WAC08241]